MVSRKYAVLSLDFACWLCVLLVLVGFVVGLRHQEDRTELLPSDFRQESFVQHATAPNRTFCFLLRRNLLVLLVLVSGILSFGILTLAVVGWNFFGLGNDLSLLYVTDNRLLLAVFNYASWEALGYINGTRLALLGTANLYSLLEGRTERLFPPEIWELFLQSTGFIAFGAVLEVCTLMIV